MVGVRAEDLAVIKSSLRWICAVRRCIKKKSASEKNKKLKGAKRKYQVEIRNKNKRFRSKKKKKNKGKRNKRIGETSWWMMKRSRAEE
jgi:hypothetical protein